MKTLYLDCAAGASGDMILAAFLDAGLDFAALRAALQTLDVPGFDVRAERVKKHGIMATRFFVDIDAECRQPHRHLGDILIIIEKATVPDAVKADAAETFRRIAECEAAIHGTTVDEVHFHEIGAVDSIVDIVGAHWALHTLGIEHVFASPLNLGSGVVSTAHGVLPVPAPATVALLEGVPAYGSDVQAELVTPTGAALVRQWACAFGPMPRMCVETIAYGAGARDLLDRPNVLRMFVGEQDDVLFATDPIVVLETNIDDMNPELLAVLVADLIEKGARDAFLAPILGKKGRPAHLLTVLCDEDKLAGVTPAIFRGSTTFGVRIRTDRRLCLDREWKQAATPWGPVRVKIGRLAGEITCLSPELEDCRRLAQERGVPAIAVYELAHAAAVKGELSDA